MNKLISTDVGGMPFDSDDLRFLDDAQRAVFEAIGKAMLNDTETIIRLFGAEVVQNGLNYDVSAGFVFCEGEFFAVPSHSVLKKVGSDTNYWSKEVTFDPAGNEAFKVAGTFDTYQIRQMKLRHSVADGSPAPEDHIETTLKSFSEMFTSIVEFDAAIVTLNNTVAATETARQKTGMVVQDWTGALTTYGSWTAIVNPLTKGDNEAVSLITNSIVFGARTMTKITIESVYDYGFDWIRLLEVNPTADADVAIIGKGMSFDGSGHVEWHSDRPATFFILNDSDTTHVSAIETYKKTQFVVHAESIDIS